ncbi:MAG: NADH-quinone oxidoreductase subunit M, partial [Gammaproteobacteria bacterium]
MVMVNLIVILLAGGVLAVLSERIHQNAPRWVALAVVAVDLVYLASHLLAIGGADLFQVPDPGNPSSWLMHYSVPWIPAFGISIELAMDGL